MGFLLLLGFSIFLVCTLGPLGVGLDVIIWILAMMDH